MNDVDTLKIDAVSINLYGHKSRSIDRHSV